MSKDESNLKCFSCHKDLELQAMQKITKNEECPYCYASIHSCKMCGFHDPSAYNECRESNAERIVEKDKANYCDYFTLSTAKNSSSAKEDLLAKASSLFKN